MEIIRINVANVYYIKVSLIVILAISCLIGILLNSLVVINIFSTCKLGLNPAFERIHRIDFNNYQVSIYRTNGGAMTSFGVIIRQEKIILPGILLVKNLFRKYPASDAQYKKVGNQILFIDGNKYSFKDNVYF